VEIEEYVLVKEKAKEELAALKQALKKQTSLKEEAVYRDQQKVYGHMVHGGKVIDVYESFKKAGLNEESDPKLAICRANGKLCCAQKFDDGAILFQADKQTSAWRMTKKNGDIFLPKKTFEWQNEEEPAPWNRNILTKQIKHKNIQALVPIIPAKLLSLVKANLSNYHIIWEVEKWQPIPPKDPILVRRLTPNLFGVIATWELTELERAIIRGRI
jgi:hypothetical protein